jgi:hypothetical protein
MSEHPRRPGHESGSTDKTIVELMLVDQLAQAMQLRGLPPDPERDEAIAHLHRLRNLFVHNPAGQLDLADLEPYKREAGPVLAAVIEHLTRIQKSSLGTVRARALRRQTAPAEISEILERVANRDQLPAEPFAELLAESASGQRVEGEARESGLARARSKAGGSDVGPESDIAVTLVRVDMSAQQFRGQIQPRDPALFEAVLAMGQGSSVQLSDTGHDVGLRPRDQTVVRTRAVDALTFVLRGVEENSRLTLHDPSSIEDTSSSVDVDHWSRGELGVLRGALANALDAVRADDSSMSIDDLRRVIEELAPEFARQLVEIVKGVAQRVIASQLRANIADQVVDALEDLGYHYTGDRYVDEDSREAITTKVTHPGGNEIVIEVVPDSTQPLISTLRIGAHEHHDGTDNARETQAQYIAESLRRQQGMDVSVL